MIVLVHANFHTKMVILFCDYCGSNISKCGADTYLSATSGVAGLLEEMFFLALGSISSFKSKHRLFFYIQLIYIQLFKRFTFWYKNIYIWWRADKYIDNFVTQIPCFRLCLIHSRFSWGYSWTCWSKLIDSTMSNHVIISLSLFH